jgi:hypothetical protein
MTGWDELDRFLRTDPTDVGCDEAIRLMHVYVDVVFAHGSDRAAARYPGIAAHFHACGPCAEDLDGLLLAASR